MARTRTQKAVSHRIDLSYFKRSHLLRTGRKAMAFVAGAIAILVLAFYQSQGDAKLHNPGHVTAHHAQFEHDCAQCHDNAGQGGFSKTVADANCIKCHDGSPHHPNQKPETVQTIPTARDPHGALMAKDCTTCHTEHRGEEVLVNSSDALCISCHENIAANSKSSPRRADNVVAFNAQQHPRFGNEFRRDGKLVDPTVLKFNHALHNKQSVLANNCTACHSTTPLPASDPVASNPPPYKTTKDAIATRDASRAEMLPISYERNCIACHALTLPGKVPVTLPHQSLAELRPFIGGLGTAYSAALNAMPDKNKELVTEVVTGRPPRQKREKVTITEQQWVEARVKELGEASDKAAGSNATYAALKKVAPTSQPAGVPVASTTEYFVTYGMGSSCNLCHTVEGSMVPSTSPAAGARATMPYTVPTGIPTTPRKWFTKSKFDHDAHRGTACLDCHQAAVTSSLTSDILSPDLDTTSTTGISCIGCHKADSTSLFSHSTRGAPSNCITCHDFHDRSREVSGPASRPAPIVEKTEGQ